MITTVLRKLKLEVNRFTKDDFFDIIGTIVLVAVIVFLMMV